MATIPLLSDKPVFSRAVKSAPRDLPFHPFGGMESAVNRSSHVLMLGGVLALVSLMASPAWADKAEKIDATKGKKYELGQQHGPWMIMVASLSEPAPESRVEGPSKAEAASCLVLELRKKGIPAYIFEQQEEIQLLGKVKRDDTIFRREVKAKDNRICVVAGNYG